MRAFIALLAGTIFGAGLALSGMVDPARVRGFLDLFGTWDATLAFVMAGALLPMAIAWRLQPRLPRAASGDHFALPSTRRIDVPLAVGALLFGVGWGIAGLCPGPAIANLALAPLAVLPFLAAMFAGMLLHRLWAAQR
ncbi:MULTISPECIES: DUF6691 family protein [Sphingomonadaceae]|jgi:uncharacterized membrane protein YedE/YeeE|uniref:YeeE/YedE family protein n=1 Tax=Novosphingobium panipatense TaxID=428991 RepID=A0ABY1QTZ7_9SPHN|nr:MULTISPECIES: DUF6691 family protein [Sphingomonadaceae]SMP80803.1 hypothetical protein SAMN06296065_11547 [Novosphingobium panipatense]